MRLSLRDDRLFVILNKVEGKKIGSIFVPDNHDERSRIGTVMEIGPGVEGYEVGDKILMSWHTGTRIHLPGETMYGEAIDEESFRVCRECEILGQVLED